MKKTKIVATVGPATETQEIFEKLLKAGVNVIRLNFSHGNFAEHQVRVDNFRKAVEATGITGAILQDLSGPKIRLGEFSTEHVELVAGENITITTEQIVGDTKRVSINYPHFPREVKPGEAIIVDDGKKRFEVVSVSGEDVLCKIIVGGDTKGRRGVNLPDSELSVKSLTEKDMQDIEFGISNNVDFVALSFVRSPKDIEELRAILYEKKSTAKIIAKIETPQAVAHIDEIIRLSDGLMVARGDLAIEVPFEKVPRIQKMLIEKCNRLGKPVITATQMLESMIKSPVATRAEVSDVANAILDGTDALMLSEETTLGGYPVEAVQTMARIAEEVEQDYPERIIPLHGGSISDVADSITGAAVKTSHDVCAKAIVALTESGFTARMVSRYKPESVILALSPSETTCRQLCLSFGCLPMHIERYESLDEVFNIVRDFCLAQKVAEKGDRVVVASGAPFNTHGVDTNMLLVETL